jgi:hypothetical protein
MAKLGFVGLGTMGGPMVKRLLAAAGIPLLATTGPGREGNGCWHWEYAGQIPREPPPRMLM